MSICTDTYDLKLDYVTTTKRACSGSLPAGSDKGLGLDCDVTSPHNATCALDDRSINCTVFDDHESRPTYHHCQDRSNPPPNPDTRAVETECATSGLSGAAAGSTGGGAAHDPSELRRRRLQARGLPQRPLLEGDYQVDDRGDGSVLIAVDGTEVIGLGHSDEYGGVGAHEGDTTHAGRAGAILDAVGDGFRALEGWYGIKGVDGRGRAVAVRYLPATNANRGGDGEDGVAFDCFHRFDGDVAADGYVNLTDVGGDVGRDTVLHELGHATGYGLKVFDANNQNDDLEEGFADIGSLVGKYWGPDVGTPASRARTQFENGSEAGDRALDGPGLVTNIASAVSPDPHVNGGLAVTIFNGLARELIDYRSLATGDSRVAERADGKNISLAARLFGESQRLMGSTPPGPGSTKASWKNWCYKTVEAASTVGIDLELVHNTFEQAGISCEPKQRPVPDPSSTPAGAGSCTALDLRLGACFLIGAAGKP